MDLKSFYNSSHRGVTHVTAMLEVRNLVETIERLRSAVLLAPAAGDDCDQASDNKEVSQDFETAFKSPGELEVKEDIDDVKEDQIGFLTERTKRRKRASNKCMCWEKKYVLGRVPPCILLVILNKK